MAGNDLVALCKTRIGEIEAIIRREDFVTREKLFENNKDRMHLRVHDLRAGFVTLSLANGKSEAWVTQRTGHTTSAMLNRYRRDAEAISELNLGWFTPLYEAVPELATLAPTSEQPNRSTFFP